MSSSDTTTVVAKKASLVALAQYIVAVDGTKVCEGNARDAFATTQCLAATILCDTLADYPFVKDAVAPAAPTE